MLRAVYNISWRDHVTIKSLYGRLPRISIMVKRRWLALAGHVSRHNEPAGKVLLWSPEVKQHIGRPHITVKTLLENDTGLSGSQLLTAMEDRASWFENFVNIPLSIDG